MDSVVEVHRRAEAPAAAAVLRSEALALFDLPFNDLLFRAHTVHRAGFDPNRVQRSTLLSIKTGGCPEDCGYCPQAARYHTGVENKALMPLDEVRAAASAAKAAGATRFCMGAAWRGPKARDLEPVLAMDGMRPEQQVVEGKVEEREGLLAKRGERRIGGRRRGRGRKSDDGIQKSSCVRH